MIWDCHTHWGPGPEHDTTADLEEWWSVPVRHGVTHAVLMPSDGLLLQGLVSADNTAVCSIASASGGRIVPVVTAVLQDERRAVEEVRTQVTENGARGVKIHSWLQGASLQTPGMRAVCRVACELGVPILFHDGTPPYALTEQVTGLAREFPDTTFVLGHSGLVWNYRSAGVSAELENCYATLCGPHARGVRWLVDTVPLERLLWGSDYGFGKSDPVRYRLALLDEIGLSPRQRRMILEENPRRLFKVE